MANLNDFVDSKGSCGAVFFGVTLALSTLSFAAQVFLVS